MSDIGKDLEVEVEKLIDQKIEESEKDSVDREELKQEILEELEEKSDKEKGLLLNKLQHSKISRRSFLKALGIGAGGLALSSSAAAGLFTFGPNKNTGPDAINADTVDGKDASQLGRVVKRNRSGNMYMQNVGNASTKATTTGVTVTTSVSTTDKVVFDSFTGNIANSWAGANLKIYRNGALKRSTTTKGGNTSFQGTPRSSNVTWTAKANFTNFNYTEAQRYQTRDNSFDNSNDTSWHAWANPDTPNGTFDALKVRVGGTVNSSSAQMGFYARTGSHGGAGNTITKTTASGPAGTTTFTTTMKSGPWTSPTLYAVVHNEHSSSNAGTVKATWYMYNYRSSATVTIQADRNQFTSH